MQHLTDIEVMEKMVKLWAYLAANPTMAKKDAYKTLKLPLDRSLCPCCAHASGFEELYFFAVKCDKCLLKNFWPGYCTGHDTAYIRWLDRDGNDDDAVTRFKISRAAREILKASKDKLKELRFKELEDKHNGKS